VAGAGPSRSPSGMALRAQAVAAGRWVHAVVLDFAGLRGVALRPVTYRQLYPRTCTHLCRAADHSAGCFVNPATIKTKTSTAPLVCIAVKALSPTTLAHNDGSASVLLHSCQKTCRRPHLPKRRRMTYGIQTNPARLTPTQTPLLLVHTCVSSMSARCATRLAAAACPTPVYC
jgi:hypothetical protein